MNTVEQTYRQHNAEFCNRYTIKHFEDYCLILKTSVETVESIHYRMVSALHPIIKRTTIVKYLERENCTSYFKCNI